AATQKRELLDDLGQLEPLPQAGRHVLLDLRAPLVRELPQLAPRTGQRPEILGDAILELRPAQPPRRGGAPSLSRPPGQNVVMVRADQLSDGRHQGALPGRWTRTAEANRSPK